MKKTILLTGATDGIGFETAKMLAVAGHDLLVHGRSQPKLDDTCTTFSAIPGVGNIESYIADLSDLSAVDAMADSVLDKHTSLDVLINNAGILKTGKTVTTDGLDIRFVVNTLAPYRLTQRLMLVMQPSSRIVNLSSAAQAPVNLDALNGGVKLEDMEAYAQSKLAITMWSKHLSEKPDVPVTIAVNPGSLLASKMVKEGFGVAGSDLGIGATILCRAALDDDFASASGKYFDNDSGKFTPPHPDGEDPDKIAETVRVIDELVMRLTQ